ncbi:hypothetical protein EON65_09130 [archaeon]|nr:MAG: hypothetical protein EON65_09130 [archaeon]
MKYASDTKELSQQLKAVEYSKEDLAVQNMQKENAIILNIEQRTQLEQQMQSMQASYKETMERHITSIGELKKEVGMLQQINIDMEMKLRLQEQELRQSVDSQVYYIVLELC